MPIYDLSDDDLLEELDLGLSAFTFFCFDDLSLPDFLSSDFEVSDALFDSSLACFL